MDSTSETTPASDSPDNVRALFPNLPPLTDEVGLMNYAMTEEGQRYFQWLSEELIRQGAAGETVAVKGPAGTSENV